MKKTIAAVLFISIAMFVGVAALSVIPHTHDGDHDHSQHPNCAVHQFSQTFSGADVCAIAPVTAAVIFLCAVYLIEKKPYETTFLFRPLRAPPSPSCR